MASFRVRDGRPDDDGNKPRGGFPSYRERLATPRVVTFIPAAALARGAASGNTRPASSLREEEQGGRRPAFGFDLDLAEVSRYPRSVVSSSLEASPADSPDRRLFTRRPAVMMRPPRWSA